eukprot:PhM_4_TR6088/c0_g1_i1/m.74605/K06990/MEMO1; MEMO1 family protein
MRPASHAGSWYSSNPAELGVELDGFLSVAHRVHTPPTPTSRLAAVICPHAGFRFSGPTAGTAYSILRDYLASNPRGKLVKRIFVLGPCHREYLEHVAATTYEAFDTVFGPLPVDTNTVKELRDKFKAAGVSAATLSARTDVEEHSLEMQMPFISRCLPEQSPIQIIPLVVGSLTPSAESLYANIMKPYVADPENIFVISSDFCHWGSRFRYTYHYEAKTYPKICDAIKAMDHEGMAHIESLDTDAWSQYLNRTQNTICGRHPISVLMHAMVSLGGGFKPKFVAYDQSSACQSKSDSSVSYASCAIWA